MQTNGKTAYEIYAEVVNWLNFRDEKMPMYEELPENIMDAWEAVGKKFGGNNV